MPLIQSHRHSSDDLRAWAKLASADLAHASTIGRKIDTAVHEICRFVMRGGAYIGVSWGKDSVVVADLALRNGYDFPLAYVRLVPRDNPDCSLVRDDFLSIHSARYHEFFVDAGSDAVTVERMFAGPREMFGDRYISGIRAAESRGRRRRFNAYGHSSKNTCAPLSTWSADDVFAYLAIYDLPIHPAYACTFGGTLDRRTIRVDALSCDDGDGIGGMGRGHGRENWERAYYPRK